MLALIGEQFEDADEIAGGVVRIRKISRLELWTKKADNMDAIRRIGEKIRVILRDPIRRLPSITYQAFSDLVNDRTKDRVLLEL